MAKGKYRNRNNTVQAVPAAIVKKTKNLETGHLKQVPVTTNTNVRYPVTVSKTERIITIIVTFTVLASILTATALYIASIRGWRLLVLPAWFIAGAILFTATVVYFANRANRSTYFKPKPRRNSLFRKN